MKNTEHADGRAAGCPDLDRQKDYVEQLFLKYHAEPVSARNQLKLRHRTTFRRNGIYYRLDDTVLEGRTFLLVSAIDDEAYADAGIMEEIAAFPADLTDEMLEREVRRVLELEEYPGNYPDYPV